MGRQSAIHTPIKPVAAVLDGPPIPVVVACTDDLLYRTLHTVSATQAESLRQVRIQPYGQRIRGVSGVRRDDMKTIPPSYPRCIACLAAWFVLIHLAADIFSPGLSRISYPQPIDLLILALIPVGALHAAKFASTGLVFTAYGGLASTVFWLYYLFEGRTSTMADDSVFLNMIITACFVTIVLAAACRLAASQRDRWERLFRPPPGHCQNCGYDLTGNVSGVCPECGTSV